MIIAVLKPCLQDVMIDIDGSVLDLDSRHAHGFELEACHCPCGILHQNAIYVKPDLLAWLHLAVN